MSIKQEEGIANYTLGLSIVAFLSIKLAVGFITLKTSTSSNVSSSIVVGSLGRTITFCTVPRSVKAGEKISDCFIFLVRGEIEMKKKKKI